jgi:polar amino acid transport system permease protein
MHWEWLGHYIPLLVHGLYLTIVLWVASVVIGGIMSVPIALVQVTGPWWLKHPARGYCTFMRGTPLLIQLWLIYYGVGSLFPGIPGIRTSFLWPILKEGFYYAILAYSLNFAGYIGEIMRGALLGVPRGELEAARAIGMSPFKVLRRVWLPRAVLQSLPTLAGEIVGQMKATPLAYTITVMDLMGAKAKITSDTYIMYEPLILVAVIYMILTYFITRAFGYLEKLIPQRR